MPDKYASNPVEIEAYQLTPDSVDRLAQWCGGQKVEEIDAVSHGLRYCAINIPTLEGVMRASEGDWIIKGTQGEFYPCKDVVFRKKYREVE